MPTYTFVKEVLSVSDTEYLCHCVPTDEIVVVAMVDVALPFTVANIKLTDGLVEPISQIEKFHEPVLDVVTYCPT